MPNVALAAKFSRIEKMALREADKCLEGAKADVAERQVEGEVSMSMLAKRVKHEAVIILESIMAFHTWEATPEQAFHQARQDSGNRAKLDKAMEEDAVVLWKRPTPLGANKSEFRLRTAKEVRREPVALRTNTAVRREEEMVEALAEDETRKVRKMPRIEGKVLSARDKTGHPMCPDFQLGICTEEISRGECPQGKHGCAVLLKSGRVCGQWHTAQCLSLIHI
mgnify:CR=1 FL=1